MTALPRAVVVAVDFSKASARAVAVAGLIVDRCRSGTLRLLHAETLDAPVYFTAEQIEALEHQRRRLRGQAEEFLSHFGRRHMRTPFTTVIDDRPPVEAILHQSATSDLVVMGTHGRHGARHWWLGSVAERVLSAVAQPLLIVRGDESLPVASTFDRVVVHAAAPLSGEPALALAHSLTPCFGGEVIDARHDSLEPTAANASATLLVVAAPQPRSRLWLSNYGAPLVQHSAVPILFVPEVVKGRSL